VNFSAATEGGNRFRKALARVAVNSDTGGDVTRTRARQIRPLQYPASYAPKRQTRTRIGSTNPIPWTLNSGIEVHIKPPLFVPAWSDPVDILSPVEPLLGQGQVCIANYSRRVRFCVFRTFHRAFAAKLGSPFIERSRTWSQRFLLRNERHRRAPRIRVHPAGRQSYSRLKKIMGIVGISRGPGIARQHRRARL